jgi:hypothetical protein
MCNDLPSPSDWALGSLAVGPKTKTIPNREVISGLFLAQISSPLIAKILFENPCNFIQSAPIVGAEVIL